MQCNQIKLEKIKFENKKAKYPVQTDDLQNYPSLYKLFYGSKLTACYKTTEFHTFHAINYSDILVG